MWLRHDLLATDALKRIRQYNRGRIETEMIQIIADIMQLKELGEFSFCIGDMVTMLNIRSVKCEPSNVRKVLQSNWKLEPSPQPIYTTTYHLELSGDISENSKTGRYYRITREQLDSFL